MREGVVWRVILGVVVAHLLASDVSAAWVKDIQISLPSNAKWFYYNAEQSYFQPRNSSGGVPSIVSGIINTYETTPQYQYQIKVATFSLTPCNLIQDNSSGGFASGQFAGGAQLTISGELWNKTTNTKLFTGLLLDASMNSAAWNLTETVQTANKVRGSNGFSPVGGVLSTGAVDGLKILNFDNLFDFGTCSPTVTNFTQNYSSLLPTVQITAPVPEPASLLLFMLCGGLAAMRKKMRN